MKIIGIKCGDLFYISEINDSNYKKYRNVNDLFINNVKVKESFHEDWNIINREPEIIQRLVPQPSTNHRYRLIDETMVSDKIPLEINKKDVCDSEGDWKDKYSMYKSLYKFLSDKQPDKLKDVEFEYETIMEVKKIEKPKNFNYSINKKVINEKNIYHQLFDEIVFPEIILPSKPCELTRKASYEVVREYVKQHINYKVATITSDYDFCFTVKKKIKLSEVENYEVDVNNIWFEKRRRKPKIETRYNKFREIECFNMAPKLYQSYSVIQGFKGKNQDDLKNNIDDYCKNLINFINEPVEDCPHCRGRGVILQEL